MSEIHRTKIWLKKPSNAMPVDMQSARMSFLRPMLKNWLNKEKIQAEAEGTGNAIQLYESSYDPEFTFSKHSYTGAMWLGYDVNELPYLRAHDASATMWFVPMMAALPSLSYFLGGTKQPYTPRIATMLQGDLMKHMFETYSSDAKLQTEVDTLGIGLWLDYDGCANYRAMVINFIRLFQRVMDEMGMGKMFSFTIYIAGSGKSFTKDELSALTETTSVSFVNNPIVMTSRCTYFVSLDTCPTSFDPLAVILAGNSKVGCKVIAAPRLDMLGTNYTGLSPILSETIFALMSRGSPGLDSMLEGAGKAIMQMFNIVPVESGKNVQA